MSNVNLYQRIVRDMEGPNRLEELMRVGSFYNSEYHKFEEVKQEARTDSLTGLLNNKGITEILEQEGAYSQRHGDPLTLGVIDLNLFKRINDEYGHNIGDQALIEVANAIQDSIRSEDVVGRYGGDEFYLVLRNTDLKESEVIMNRINDAISSIKIDGIPESFSASIGYAQMKHGETYQQTLGRADKAMYEAKRTVDTKAQSGLILAA